MFEEQGVLWRGPAVMARHLFVQLFCGQKQRDGQQKFFMTPEAIILPKALVPD